MTSLKHPTYETSNMAEKKNEKTCQIIYLENNDCVTRVFMILFRNQRKSSGVAEIVVGERLTVYDAHFVRHEGVCDREIQGYGRIKETHVETSKI